MSPYQKGQNCEITKDFSQILTLGFSQNIATRNKMRTGEINGELRGCFGRWHPGMKSIAGADEAADVVAISA